MALGNKSNTDKKFSDEHRQKISNSLKGIGKPKGLETRLDYKEVNGRLTLLENTEAKSVAVFDSFEELMLIHGHDIHGHNDNRFQSEIVYYDIKEN